MNTYHLYKDGNLYMQGNADLLCKVLDHADDLSPFTIQAMRCPVCHALLKDYTCTECDKLVATL